MKKYFLCAFLVFGLILSGPVLAEEERFFPEDTLNAPEDEAHKEYLGIEGQDTFVIQDVEADLAIVQLFSMYCPICQREARSVNELYELTHEQGLSDRIKLFGLAPGNSRFEVGVFRDQYDVPFPLIPDPDFEWHQRLGEVGTPTYIVVKTEDASVLKSHTGPFPEGPQGFLQSVADLL